MKVTLYQQLLANTEVEDDDLGMGQNNVNMLHYQAQLWVIFPTWNNIHCTYFKKEVPSKISNRVKDKV